MLYPIRPVMRWAARLALIGATIIMPAGEGTAASITVHAPDGKGRVFVDVVGPINDQDYKIFKEKTDQINPIGASSFKKQVIVTLISPGGNLTGLHIGELIREKTMSTFVPEDRECMSVCALIWLAGTPRTVGENNVRIGFHAAFNRSGGEVTGPGNALVGAYLAKLGLGYRAVVGMTAALPGDMTLLDPNRAKEWDVTWEIMQAKSTVSIPTAVAPPQNPFAPSRPKIEDRPLPVAPPRPRIKDKLSLGSHELSPNLGERKRSGGSECLAHSIQPER
jgi:hypothetical protein